MESIYESHLPEMQRVMEDMQRRIESLRRHMADETGMDPVEHCLARIKSEESMREKCRRQALPETAESALEQIYDAIGFRIVCAFLNDVYMIRDHLAGMLDVKVIKEKDYIRRAKPNGYRSYHMIVRTERGYYVEFQIRTISMDTWGRAGAPYEIQEAARRKCGIDYCGAKTLRGGAGLDGRFHADDSGHDF